MNHLIKLVTPFLFFSLTLILSSGEICGQQSQRKSDTIKPSRIKEKSDSIIQKLKNRISDNKLKDQMEVANAYWDISHNYEDKGELDSAIKYVKKGWKIAKEKNYQKYFDQYLAATSYFYWLKGNYSKALSYLMEAERNIEHADSSNIKNIYNTFGLTYSQLGNYQLAEKYYFKAIKTAEKLGIKGYTGVVNANLGRLYYKQGKLDKALEFFQKGSKIELEDNRHSAAGRSFVSMANIYLDKNQPDKAGELLEKARKQNKIANDNIGLCRTYIGFGNLYLYKSNVSKAGVYFHKAEKLAKDKGTEKELMQSYKGLYETYYKGKTYHKAFDYLKKYQEIYKNSYNINEIIKAEKLQHELNMQNEINKRQKNEIENQKTTNRLLIIILFLIVVLAVILTIMFFKGKKHREYLREKNIEVQSQKEKLQKLNEELEQAKAKTEESERLKDQFLRNISHEIRTPLNEITGLSSVIADKTTNQEDRDMYHQMIEKNANTLLNTIDDIMDIAKIKTQQIQIQKETVNINTLLQELKETFFYDKDSLKNDNIKIIAEIHEEDNNRTIQTDPYKIRKILITLIKNSIKFTHKGKIKFGYRHQDTEPRFFVSDTGIGISESSKKEIFNSFNQLDNGLTRNYDGLGIGLTIAKSFVEILGGKIWFDTEINKGTTFYFTIPEN